MDEAFICLPPPILPPPLVLLISTHSSNLSSLPLLGPLLCHIMMTDMRDRAPEQLCGPAEPFYDHPHKCFWAGEGS